MNNNKIEWVNIAKGIGILLVIYGHVVRPRSVYIYSFHMPFFFYISGFLYNQKYSFQDYLKRKASSLLLPYINFSIISWLFYFIIGITNKEDFSNYIEILFQIFLGRGDNGGNDVL